MVFLLVDTMSSVSGLSHSGHSTNLRMKLRRMQRFILESLHAANTNFKRQQWLYNLRAKIEVPMEYWEENYRRSAPKLPTASAFN